MKACFWKIFTLTLLSTFLFLVNTKSIYTGEYLDDFNHSSLLNLNDTLTQIELDFFSKTLSNADELLDIITDLEKNVSSSDIDKTTPYHFVYARAIYLSALVFPEQTPLSDIFEAVLIEEALIPFINTLNYNVTLPPDVKSLWKILAISFYSTQAHYNFLGQNKPSQAIVPLQIAISLNPESFFLLYELALLEKHIPHLPLTINPTQEIEKFLHHPYTTALERALIYLMLSSLEADKYNDYLAYAHTAWLAAITLGATPETMIQHVNAHLPKPLQPSLEKLFIQRPT